MSMQSKPEVEATLWLIRQRDPSFSDWSAFGDWLAADCTNGPVYRELAILDADADRLLARDRGAVCGCAHNPTSWLFRQSRDPDI
jgi:ferric-dicitrate binding protein FerR (iron transport regulator)